MVDDEHLAHERASLLSRLAAGGLRWRRRARELIATGQVRTLLRMLFVGLWLRSLDVTPVDALVLPRGRYVHHTRTGLIPSYRLLPYELPPGVERVGGARFIVEIDRVTTYCGFSYAPGGWHPFAEILRAYEKDPALRYEDSALARLYRTLTPANVQEAIFDDAPVPLPPLDQMPAVHEVLKSLWQLDRRQVERLVRGAPYAPVLDDHSRYLGPKTDARGRSHFGRVVAMYHSVQRHGYDPARFGGGLPRGYFLVRDGEYRFVMSRGNHRVPALYVTGVRRFVATVRVHHPPVVDAAYLARWSTARGGPYPLPVAERLFDRMFAATGAERADALHLR